MAVPVVGKKLLDNNVFIGYLRAGLHAEWVCGRVSNTIRYLMCDSWLRGEHDEAIEIKRRTM